MQNAVNARGLSDHYLIDSAGTHAYHIGEQSDPRSRSKAAEKGVDMEFIRARKIAITDFDQFDYILAMDTDNLKLIEYNAPSDHAAHVSLFLDFASLAGETERSEVPDPYYGGAEGFEDVFQLVKLGCNALLEHIEQSRENS